MLCVAVSIVAFPIRETHAQPSPSRDPLRFMDWAASDLRELLPSVARIRPVLVLATGGAVYLASRFDRRMRDRTDHLAGRESMRVLEEFGNVKAIRPMSLLIFVGSLMQRDTRFQDAAFTSIEAIVLSDVMVNALKALIGRSRPNQNEGSDSFGFFSGNTSFPSGHSATVFAFITPWVIYYSNAGTYLLVGLAAGTAFSRVATRFHWFSDIVAGSALGFWTAHWLAGRHNGEGVPRRITPVVSLNRIGITVGL
ncbi:MAG: phosphatase PAP2 family protein [Bacteroidetes bacterium]|nr:phosphatase PAP2 family protein [Bacteroidota bacterium]